MIGVRATASIRPSRRLSCGSRASTIRHLRFSMTVLAASYATMGLASTIRGTISG
jgi:hypothetical protein